MLNQIQRSSWALLVVMVSLLLPSTAFAQAAITGVVKDASGGVLPGVTVEAASPVLIEKVRSVVSDASGQYRIVDLRPGTYSVTFSLPGFSTVKREGIELSGAFVATVNGDLKVGTLEETITVTGETPIVDVQSAKVQQTVSNNYSGSVVFSGANGSMQGSNYTQRLQDAGLKTPSELLKVYDISPMGGGRIVRDKLWFYLTFRQTSAESTVPGMWFNKNAGNPNAWTVDFDKSRPAFSDGVDKNGIGRITWQATPRNKINLNWSEQYNASSNKGG